MVITEMPGRAGLGLSEFSEKEDGIYGNDH